MFSEANKINVNIYQDFKDLPKFVVEFWQKASQRDYFQGFSWFSNFVETVVSNDDSIYIYVLTDTNDSVCMILPLWNKCGKKGIWPIHVINGLSNYYSPYFQPIWNENADVMAVLDTLVYHFKHFNPSWHAMTLAPMDLGCVNNSLLVQVLKNHGLWVRPYFACANWIINLHDSDFSTYFKSRPSKLRNTYHRRRKKLEQEHKYVIKVFRDNEDIEEAISSYEFIYDKSWKQNEPYVNFIPGLIRTCSKDDKLRLGVLYINNKPAASQLWIISGNSAAIYKLAYDPAFKSYSVGTILTMHLAEHVITYDTVSCLDYLTGDDSYKSEWMDTRRELMGLYVINPSTIKGKFLIAKENLSQFKHRISRTKKSNFENVDTDLKCETISDATQEALR